jgi:cytochrome P450
MQVFDYHTEEFARNWRGIYADLRSRCPVLHSDRHDGFTVITRYRDCRQILNDPGTFASGREFDHLPGVKGGIALPQNPIRMGMMEMDPPESTRYRRILAPRFTAKAVASYEPRLREIVTWTLDRVIESGEIDFVDDLANPLPALVSLDYIGLPLGRWVRYASILHSAVYREAGSAREIGWLLEDLHRIIRERREEGPDTRDDLVSALLTTESDGEPLCDQIIVELIFMLLNGGIDTSTALIAHMLGYLDQHRDIRTRLAADPALIPNAVDEMLRYVTPGPGLARTVVRPTEVSGHRLEPGDRVWIAFGSANTDETLFPDPHRIDIGRANASKHLALGSGVHRCLGAFLAAAEMRILLEELLERMPDYRIDHRRVQAYPRIPLVNGFIRMPASFTPGPRLRDSEVRETPWQCFGHNNEQMASSAGDGHEHR